MLLQHRGCGGELDDRRRCLVCGADVTVTEAEAIRTGRIGRTPAALDRTSRAGQPSSEARPGAQARPPPRVATVHPMSDDTTWMDATAQAELVRTKKASPSELVDAAIARVEKLNPQLNAVIHELFERARAEASGAAARRPVPRRAVPVEGSRRRTRRHAVQRGARLLRRLPLDGDPDPHAALHRRRLRHLRQDERARARHPPDDRATPLRTLAQPLEHRPLDRGILGRLGGGRGIGHGAGRPCQRRRRLHPDPGLVLRPGRIEAHPGTQLAGPSVRRLDGRPGGRARRDPLGTRLGGHPRRHRRSGSRRPVLGPAAGAVPPLPRPWPRRPRDCAWRS